MGIITAICISEKKGTAKREVGQAEIIVQHGIKGDAHAASSGDVQSISLRSRLAETHAHAGNGHRQISLLSLQKIQAFREKGAQVNYGDFGENLVIDGIDLSALPVGTKLRSGKVLLEVSQIGKECHNRCAIYHTMGDCIMPREGVFAVVLEGGTIKTGDKIYVE